MQQFPVSSSILSTPHLGAWVQQQWALAVTDCKLLRAGINHSYLITTDTDKYVLRIYSLGWRSATDIAEEIRLINTLAENGIPVSTPVTDAGGNYIHNIIAPEGERHAVLFTYARGNKIITYPDAMHTTIGRTMAQLHLYTESLSLKRTTYTPETLLVQSLPLLHAFMQPGSEELEYMHTMQGKLLDILHHADTSRLRSGAVHLDIWFDNLNMDGDNITLFDFDFCGNGWLCLDVAYYLMQLHFTEPDNAEFRRKTAAFLQGYEAIIPLTVEEKRLLPALGTALYFFYLGVQCQRFENYSSIFLSDTYLKRYIMMRVKRWADYCDANGLA